MTLTTQIRLTVQGRRTAAYLKLLEGQTSGGAQVQILQQALPRRSDHALIVRLTQAGWLEARQGGPRGGRRWYTTPAGSAALEGS